MNRDTLKQIMVDQKMWQILYDVSADTKPA